MYRTILLFVSISFMVRSVALSQSVRLSILPDSIRQYLPVAEPLEKLHNLQDRLQTALQEQDQHQLGEISYRLGKFYRSANLPSPAYYWLLQAARSWEPLGPSADLVKLYIQLGSQYGILLQHTQQLAYARLALQTARQVHTSDSTHSRMSAYVVMAGMHAPSCKAMYGNTHLPLNSVKENHLGIWSKSIDIGLKCDSAFYYYQLALQKARELNEPDEIPGIQISLGTLWGHINVHRAIPYYQSALTGYIHFNHPVQVVSVRLLLAQCYLKLHQSVMARHLIAEASQTYRKAHLNEPLLMKEFARNYADLNYQTGKFLEAYQYQKQVYEAELSTLNADRDGSLARMGLFYQMEQQQDQLKIKQQDLELSAEKLKAEQKLRYILLAGFGIAVIVGIAFYQLSQKNRRISNRNAALVTEQNHRVKNNLQAISDLMTLQLYQLTDETSKKIVSEMQLRIQAISLLHKRLYDNSQQEICVKFDDYIIALVKHILDTYGLESIQPIYELDDIWLSTDQTLSSGLILSEVVTNACKYALVGHATPQLKIQVRQSGSKIQMIVQDNGPGISLSRQKATTYGLKLLRIQAEQLRGQYTLNNQNGTRFELLFSSLLK